MDGTFITFEGIDGSGKSTQLSLLVDVLASKGVDAVCTREPGGTPLGRRLRAAFLETEEEVAPLAELLLFAADRAQHVEYLIKPAVAAGKVVISDRFADATAAYQGAGRGFPKDTIEQLITMATGGLKPDLTLIFDLPVKDAIGRMSDRSHTDVPNRMDAEDAVFYERVRASYLEIADREPERVHVIDAAAPAEEVAVAVSALILPYLSRYFPAAA